MAVGCVSVAIKSLAYFKSSMHTKCVTKKDDLTAHSCRTRVKNAGIYLCKLRMKWTKIGITVLAINAIHVRKGSLI